MGLYGKQWGELMDESLKLLWTQSEVVAYLSLGKSTVQMMTADGSLPSIKIGARRLYPREEIEGWVNDQLAMVTAHEA